MFHTFSAGIYFIGDMARKGDLNDFPKNFANFCWLVSKEFIFIANEKQYFGNTRHKSLNKLS